MCSAGGIEIVKLMGPIKNKREIRGNPRERISQSINVQYLKLVTKSVMTHDISYIIPLLIITCQAHDVLHQKPTAILFEG